MMEVRNEVIALGGAFVEASAGWGKYESSTAFTARARRLFDAANAEVVSAARLPFALNEAEEAYLQNVFTAIAVPRARQTIETFPQKPKLVIESWALDIRHRAIGAGLLAAPSSAHKPAERSTSCLHWHHRFR